MNLLETVQIFCSSGKALTKSMISVEWDGKYNMKHHSTLHSLIDKVWEEKSKYVIKLFNRPKFRLHQVDMETKSDSFDVCVRFLLGTTDYKQFTGTNCAPFAEQLVQDGISDMSDFSAYLANPIGVGGILESKDGDLIFMRRSNICAEMPGLIDRPGGHPEPDEVFSKFGQNVETSAVIDEIFDSVLKEIRDEINIPIENLSTPLLLGISYNPSTYKRPSLEFYVRCNLKTEDVLALYSKQTQSEAEESTALITIPVAKILDIDNFESWDIYKDFTHAAQCAVYLLQIFLK